MLNYQKMYLSLFNAISDAVDELLKQNYGNATKILKEAQWKCEDMYILQDHSIEDAHEANAP